MIAIICLTAASIVFGGYIDAVIYDQSGDIIFGLVLSAMATTGFFIFCFVRQASQEI